MLQSIIARIQSVFAWWMADIQKRKSFAGKAASAGIGLLLFCCVCSVGLGAVRGTGQAIGLVATNTPSPVPSVTPIPGPPTLIPTDAPTSTPEPSRTPRPTFAPLPSRTPEPTQTLVPTFTPEPTIATDRAGIAPVNGDCPAHYRIKISSNGVAHDLESGSYSRTNPVHCYATMKDATDHGYTIAGD